MPRIIEQTVYTFAELSDDAKERARNWYRKDAHEFFDPIDMSLDDWQSIAEILGIEFDTRAVFLMNGSTRRAPVIYYSGFCSQGDGASWQGWYSYAKQAPKRIRAHAPNDTALHEIADTLQSIQRRNFYRLQATVTQSGHYVHEMTMRADVTRTDDIYPSESDCEDVQEALRDFARWMYRQMESQWEYIDCAVAVDESIVANEYEFDSEGNPA